MEALIGFMRRSRNRIAVLRALGRSILTTNKIAARTRLRVSTVRAVLNDLKAKGLVRKLAGKKGAPMIFEITRLGIAVLDMKDNFGQMRWKGSSRQKRVVQTVKERLKRL